MDCIGKKYVSELKVEVEISSRNNSTVTPTHTVLGTQRAMARCSMRYASELDSSGERYESLTTVESTDRKTKKFTHSRCSATIVEKVNRTLK